MSVQPEIFQSCHWNLLNASKSTKKWKEIRFHQKRIKWLLTETVNLTFSYRGETCLIPAIVRYFYAVLTLLSFSITI